ncbi:hypothetical protein DPMN_005143 [Dreissena polymorpha]|uniref:Secreted protein n=1 Tax=Dreissena polymorpha TaxID=45954 RepID=A0A9D4RW77_DREPO|nr:hypothetical protein DPMN_005143 [Dreissena polymorpha]
MRMLSHLLRKGGFRCGSMQCLIWSLTMWWGRCVNAFTEYIDEEDPCALPTLRAVLRDSEMPIRWRENCKRP